MLEEHTEGEVFYESCPMNKKMLDKYIIKNGIEVLLFCPKTMKVELGWTTKNKDCNYVRRNN